MYVSTYNVPVNTARNVYAPVSKGGDLVGISMPADSEDSYLSKKKKKKSKLQVVVLRCSAPVYAPWLPRGGGEFFGSIVRLFFSPEWLRRVRLR